MKKIAIATAAVVGTIALAACTEEAKAQPTVYGSVEYAMSFQDGVQDVKGGDNIIGIKHKESFGEGAGSAFAKIEFKTNSENSASDGVLSNRESYVGLEMSGVTVQAGRMKNLEKSFVAGTVDVFEGDNSFGTAGADRVPNAVALTTEVGGITIGTARITDGATGEDTLDAYEVGAKATFAGVNFGAVMTKDRNANTTTKVVSAGVEVAGLDLGVGYQPDATNKTTTVVAQYTAGNNVVRVGQEMVTDGDNTTIAEVAHNFSKNTSAYINWAKADNAVAETLVGMRVNF